MAFHPWEAPEQSNPEAGSARWGLRLGERGFDGDRVSVWEDEKVLEMDVVMVITAM